MSSWLKLVGIVGLATSSGLSAQGLSPTVIGVILGTTLPKHNGSGRWVYDTDADYAVWDATATTVVGSEVSLLGKGGAVDQASLVPQSLYETDQDLVADGKVWLPKDGLLVKMVGGEKGGNWFCTWRFDQIALSTSAQFPKGERELCLQTDGADHTIANRLEISLFPALLTILPSMHEMRIKNANAVNLHETDRNTLPPRTALKILAEWHSRKGGTVCLHGQVDEVEALGEECFGGVGQSIEYAGGRYTWTATGQNNSFTIRIDRALNIRGLAPKKR